MPSKALTFTILPLAITLLIASKAWANDPIVVDTSKVGKGQYGVVKSDQMLELGTSRPSALRLEGEQAMRFNDLEKAITVLQRAVEISPADIDGRVLYATALEKKLTGQEERDPQLYNFVIKQWLYVAKNSDYMDQSLLGQKHLKNLTGSKPGRFEPCSHFLSRVLLPEDGSIKVAFGHKKPTKTE